MKIELDDNTSYVCYMMLGVIAIFIVSMFGVKCDSQYRENDRRCIEKGGSLIGPNNDCVFINK